MKAAISSCLIALSLTACTGINTLGTDGRYKFQEIYTINAVAPSATALIAVNKETGELIPLPAAGSAGWLLEVGKILGLATIAGAITTIDVPDTVSLEQ